MDVSMDIYRRKKSVSGATRGPRGWGARLPASWPHRSFLAFNSKSPGCLLVQEIHRESFILFGLRLVFLFCETLKQGKTHKLALGYMLIG